MLDRARQLLDDLKLSDEQKQKADAILQKAKEDFRSMREQFEKDGTEARERMQKIGERMRQLREDVSNLLTDEQRKQFEDKLQEARGRVGGGDGARHRGAEEPRSDRRTEGQGAADSL
jgi:Spy/CpxP family protein refolding chaperone